jgi:hypothetical protein
MVLVAPYFVVDKSSILYIQINFLALQFSCLRTYFAGMGVHEIVGIPRKSNTSASLALHQESVLVSWN